MKIEFIFDKEHVNYEIRIDGKHFGTINAGRHVYDRDLGQHHFYYGKMVTFVISECPALYEMEVKE